MDVSSATLVRFAVAAAQSWLDIEGRSTVHSVKGRTTALDGFVEIAMNDGSFVLDPMPKMQLSFPIQSLRTGNAAEDKAMWGIADSIRFPRAMGELRSIRQVAGGYMGSGEITLAGRKHTYEGALSISHVGDSVAVDGSLQIDIRDFGLTPPSMLFLKVDPVVKTTLHLVAARTA